MTDPRVSTGTTQIQDGRWRSVIRTFAIIGAIIGLVLIGNEVIENVACPEGVADCSKIHMSTFLVGFTMFGFCLLVLQKGDVSASLQQATTTVTTLRDSLTVRWFTRAGRDTDKPGTVVASAVVVPPTPPPETK